MSESAAGGKIQETDIGRYRSTRGLDYESVPWKLWEKSKKLFWDPADLDFSQDAVDWQEMTEEERTLVALSARGFMVGEEAVTLDIVPLLRCMSDLGRLEDTMYLAMFAMEEAKHTEMFRRWFDAVGMDRPRSTTSSGRGRRRSAVGRTGGRAPASSTGRSPG
jgi:ribonucleotide reductase beta subunit family protein with ferritin-like domain